MSYWSCSSCRSLFWTFSCRSDLWGEAGCAEAGCVEAGCVFSCVEAGCSMEPLGSLWSGGWADRGRRRCEDGLTPPAHNSHQLTTQPLQHSHRYDNTALILRILRHSTNSLTHVSLLAISQMMLDTAVYVMTTNNSSYKQITLKY